MKKLLIVLAIVVVISVIGVRVYTAVTKKADIVAEVSYVSVEGETVQKGAIADYTIVTGTVSANNSVSILPTVPALVDEIYVAVGDVIKEGDQLFQLNLKNIDNQVTQADTGVKTASASVEQAQLGILNAQMTAKQAELGYELALANYNANLEKYQFSIDNLAKYKELYDAGVVSESEYKQMALQASESTLVLLQKQLEQAEQSKNQASIAINNANISLKQAQAGLSQAQQGYEQVQDARGDMTFTTPINGIISSINITKDVFASNAQPAIIVEDIDKVKVTISVTESIINKLKKGDEVEIHFTALQEAGFKGSILTISPSANQRTLLYDITIEVDNKDHVIKPGMFANVKIRTDIIENALYVKGSAVFYQDGRTFIYIQKDETSIELRNITIGIDNGDLIEVTSGLKPEDIYIYKGVGFLDEDTAIKMIRGDQ